MKTTLNEIRAKSPCIEGWAKLLKHLGKTVADDEPLSIVTVLDSNGLDDAMWCLQAVKGHDREIRLYAAWCARQVQYLMTDKRSLDALYVAERFANGEELTAARAEAWAATRSAAFAAGDAAGTAAWDAAAWAAARAAWAAAGAAAGAAARAAGAAARAAGGAGGGAGGAGGAAGGASWAAQEKRLRELCAEVAA